jgi:hypothetical protein
MTSFFVWLSLFLLSVLLFKDINLPWWDFLFIGFLATATAEHITEWKTGIRNRTSERKKYFLEFGVYPIDKCSATLVCSMHQG